MTGEWITRLADDERKRDHVRLRVSEAVTRKAELVALHGQRLLDELRTTVMRDIETFRGEFPGDAAREIHFEAIQADGSFFVRKPAFPNAALSVAPRLLAGSLSCEYHFTPANGLPPREDRLELSFATDAGDETLHIKHHGSGQLFTSADALSEFLLAPIFTGRPR